MIAEQRTVARCVAECESFRVLLRDSASLEIVARRLPIILLPELPAKELARRRVHLPERFAGIRPLALPRHLLHLDANARADPLHGLDEVETEMFLHEAEDVSLLAAHEAHVRTTWKHREVVVLPLMKRTRAAKAGADSLQLHELADDLDDVRFVSHSVDDVIRDHQSSATVT